MLNLKAKVRTLASRYLRIGRPVPNETEMAFELLTSITPRIKRGVMLDVGAHFGSALTPFAEHGWQIFAFEPDPCNRERLVKSFGSFPNVHIDPRGVSDEPRENVDFYTSKVSTGISGLSAFHPSHVATARVALTTLARFCAETRTHHVDFLKIDTEGFDLFVLRGFPWNLTRPRVIICEFEDAKTVPLGYSFKDLEHFLLEKGYRLVVSEWYPIKEYGAIHDWRCFKEYPCELEDPKAWGNIIAVSSDDLFNEFLKICRKYSRGKA